MNTTDHALPGIVGSLRAELRRQWGWLLTIGILVLVLGILAVVDSVLATVVSMLYVGWALVIAGVVFAVQAFRFRAHGHLFLHLLNAALALVVGVILILHPVAAAVTLTLLLAVYFVVAGIFRTVTALSVRVPGWGWGLVNGIVTLILGILIWTQWPVSGLWVIGLFVGIDLIVIGWTQIMTAFAARSLKD